MDWSRQQLLTFHTVARLGTMTRAAEALGYTTGAVSQQISNLEQAIGARLFARLPRKLALTEVGEIFLDETARILACYSQAAVALENLTPQREVTLRLGVFTSVAVAFLPSALERLGAENPHIRVELREIKISDARDALERGELDLALSVNYPNIPTEPPRGVISKTLHTEAFSLMTGRDDPLSFEELREADWILPPAGSLFGRSVRLALQQVGIAPRVTHVLENHVASVALAEAGHGITPVTATTLALSGKSRPQQGFPGEPRREIVMFCGEAARNRVSSIAVEDAIRSAISHAEA